LDIYIVQEVDHMRLYIIRHGDPDYENNTITKAGHLEAEALSRRLASQGLDRIYCSPMGRAIHTMNYTAKALNKGYEIQDWMREMHPELWLEDERWGTIAAFELPGEIFRCGASLPTHSTWQDVKNFKGTGIQQAVDKLRVNSDSFLYNLGYERVNGLYRCNKHNEEQIAVFCHAGFALTWLALLLEIPVTLMWSGFWLPPSSVTTVLFEKRSDEWAVPRCIGFGDISHLYEAGLPVSTMGIKANFF
jgi:broad specificity phosphatase PhoE